MLVSCNKKTKDALLIADTYSLEIRNNVKKYIDERDGGESLRNSHFHQFNLFILLLQKVHVIHHNVH